MQSDVPSSQDKTGGTGLPSYQALSRRLLGTSAYVTGAQIALLLLNFAVLGVLSRYLSLKALGIYTILMEVGRIVSIFCQAGTVQSSQKFLGRMTYNAPMYLPQVQRRIFLVLLTASVITLTVCAVFWNITVNRIFHGQGLVDLAFFGCSVIITMAMQNYYASVLMSVDSMFRSVLSSGLAQKAALLAGITFVYACRLPGDRLYIVLWIWVCSGYLSILQGWWFVSCKMRQLSRISNLSSERSCQPGMREIISTSLPMGVTTGMATLRNSVDVVIVGSVLGPAAAGIYGPLRSIANLVLFIDQAVVRSLPATLAACGHSMKVVERLCRSSANYGTCAAFLPAVVLIFGGSLLLKAILGPHFADAGVLVAILAGGVCISAIFGSGSSLLQVHGREMDSMIVNSAATAMSVACMPFVAKYYGLFGVVCASSAFVVLQAAVLAHVALRRFGVRTWFSVALLRAQMAVAGSALLHGVRKSSRGVR